MCGIAGFVGNGDEIDLKKMNSKLLHRGPDESASFTNKIDKVFLTHTRLSILDIENGKQPMATRDNN